MDPTIFLVLFISSFECMGEICLKKLHLNPQRFWLFIAAVTFYTVVCFLLFIAYRYNGMGIVHVLWSGVSILLVLSVGIFYFNEQVTLLDKVGIVCIIIGMILILWTGENERDHIGRLFESI